MPPAKVRVSVPPATVAAAPATPSVIQFRDVSAQTGIGFLQTSGDSNEKLFPTANGSGVAMLDYDRDGWIDLYFSTTRNLPRSTPNQSKGNRLYRNLGDGTYQDVTDAAGVGFNGFNHTPAAGDVNGDGFPDLLLTNFGPNVLYLNNGDGTFRDASAGSGLTEIPWSSGAAFFDYDNDGVLDVYISCYGEWSEDGEHPFCGTPGKIRTYCSPLSMTPARHYLFHGRGDGTFEDVTEAAGVLRTGSQGGRGMQIVAVDVNRDGWIDLYVANDLCPHFLFINNKNGTFQDVSESSGAACSESGQNQAGMGVDAVDIDDGDGDNKGLPELFCTHFAQEYNTLYHNLNGEFFTDISAAAGIVKDSLPDVGWGCALDDFDNDGLPDMFVVNGHVDNNLPVLNNGPKQAERCKVWRNVGGRRFAFQPNPGPYFQTEHVCRGAGFGDLDNDGRIDAVVVRMDATPVVLKNESAPRSWIAFDLAGHQSNRDAIGADLEIHLRGGRTLFRQVRGGRSYHSTPDVRLCVGLGDATAVDEVVIRWPRGGVTKLAAPELRRQHLVREPGEDATRGAGR
jgi:hypothetical protein